MTAEERRELSSLVAGAPELADLMELYEKSNGVDLFYLKCPNCDEPHWALSFLPISEWAAATAHWQPGGDCGWCTESCELYKLGTWRVVASLPSEELRLVQFFSGEEGEKKLSGKIFCIGLDGYLGYEEEVAPSLSALLDEIVRDPAAFFKRLGFSWVFQTDEGYFGDVIGSYLPDMRGDPDAQPWSPTRPTRPAR